MLGLGRRRLAISLAVVLLMSASTTGLAQTVHVYTLEDHVGSQRESPRDSPWIGSCTDVLNATTTADVVVTVSHDLGN